jgi:hypothetical protein
MLLVVLGCLDLEILYIYMLSTVLVCFMFHMQPIVLGLLGWNHARVHNVLFLNVHVHTVSLFHIC